MVDQGRRDGLDVATVTTNRANVATPTAAQSKDLGPCARGRAFQ